METRDIFYPYLNHLLFSQKIKTFYVSSVDFKVDWQNLLLKKFILKSWMERCTEVKYTYLLLLQRTQVQLYRWLASAL